MGKLNDNINAILEGDNKLEHDITLLCPSHDKAYSLFDEGSEGDGFHIVQHVFKDNKWEFTTVWTDNNISPLDAILELKGFYSEDADPFINTL